MTIDSHQPQMMKLTIAAFICSCGLCAGQFYHVSESFGHAFVQNSKVAPHRPPCQADPQIHF
eukprot:3355580-Amphidinium_carterae.1